MSGNNKTLLHVDNLNTQFLSDGIPIQILRNVSFDIYKGEILGLVGESGSGKSVTAKTILKLLPSPPASAQCDNMIFDGLDIQALSRNEMLKIRGARISMIFQEPMTSLNPVFTCGDQIIEGILTHNRSITYKQAREQAIELMRQVGIPMPEVRIKAYPHELSGGMRQRVMIAIALSCNPQMMIADEPTTALDSTIQAQIIELIKKIRDKRHMSVLYITHDLGVVAETCDRVIVMYGGHIVEQANVRELFKNPQHPYTMGLLKAVPRLDMKVERLYTIKGNVPPFAEMPKGCHFSTRCPFATEKCYNELPELSVCGEDHLCRCFYHGALIENA